MPVYDGVEVSTFVNILLKITILHTFLFKQPVTRFCSLQARYNICEKNKNVTYKML